MDNRNILVLTTLSCLFLGFIVPLIVWILMKDKFEGGEKSFLVNLLNFELTLLIGFVILAAINVVPILGQLVCAIGSFVLWLIGLIVAIVATVKLTKNEEYKFPMTLELIK